MPVAPLNAVGDGAAFMIAAGLVNEIIAANCSSPQTAEINADKRSATLMKWVGVGVVESIVFVAIAAMVEPKHARAIVWGGALAGGLKTAYYVYANRAGLADAKPGTES